MNINTPLIKNKKFKTAISNKLVKVSQEYRVLAILRYLFPGKYDQMGHGDKPDLQDTTNHIGIEATAAVHENDMKVSSEFTKINKNSSKSDNKILDKIEECGYRVDNYNGIMTISKFGTSNSEKLCLCNAILKKVKKADTYKNSFISIGLAVLLCEITTSDAEDHIIDWIKEIYSEIKQSFDYLYVIFSRFCIMYDIRSDHTDKKCLKSTDNQLLCTIARMTAEGELTLDSFEWK